MFDILSVIPGKKKLTGSGWHSFNAVCCHHKGHRPDRRQRAGIKFDTESNWSMNCFNCGFKCGFTLGKGLTKNTRQLLVWCGVDENQINKWHLESLQHRDFLVTHTKKKKEKITFKEVSLPLGDLIDPNNKEHEVYIDYLSKRKVNYFDYPFLVTPNELGRNAKRIIIPYTYKNKIVGHTSRFIDDRKPKYISEQQPGYVFGYDLQEKDWEFCIVVEGIFDAISISGCGLLHATISDEQANLLRNLHKKVIVVPDQDKTGLEICERALDLGFYVSIPEWDSTVKDVNDAVIKYGKLATLLSIIQYSTNSKIKVEMQRRKLDKRV